MLRFDWSAEEILATHALPVPELLFRAQTIHRRFFDPTQIQLCTLLSVKTGGCPEDCAYCPQSAHYATGVSKEKLWDIEDVLARAQAAKEAGSTRFCLGAAWRQVRDGPEFDAILAMVRGVSDLGMEACCTLGMLTERQAAALKQAGLTAYNHNLDTGAAYYARVISTRTYNDRLQTLRHVRQAGIQVCCGGIVGMGEALQDRIDLLAQLANTSPHPESVPINALVQVPGTPLARSLPCEPFDFVRMVATARIVMPTSRVRLSAGRASMSEELQALCFLAGANSIHTGEKLLTTPTHAQATDHAMLSKLGLHALAMPEAADIN